ncbi:MAG: class I SAM-dependent methyltransferase [Chlamydiia bacterium]
MGGLFFFRCIKDGISSGGRVVNGSRQNGNTQSMGNFYMIKRLNSLKTLLLILLAGVGHNLLATRLQDDLKQAGVDWKEGHIYTAGAKQPATLSTLLDSNRELLIMETGFNAGFSSELFLSVYPHSKVISFDLGSHRYVAVAKRLIDQYFPCRHTLVLGNSVTTLPKFIHESDGLKADVIFIDGGHSKAVALADIRHFRELATPETIVVIDDYSMRPVAEAINECVQNGIFFIERTETDQHKKWVVGRYICP